MSMRETLVVLLMISLLVIFIFSITKYFNKIEKFVTIVYNKDNKPNGKYGIICRQCGSCNAGTFLQNCGGLNHGMCQWCSRGHYSTQGSTACTQCDNGEQPNSNKDACEDCPAGKVGTLGTCDISCSSGTKPNSNKDACENCPGAIGDGTTCIPCNDGKRPSTLKVVCENCPAGTAGTGGNCNTCGRGKYQDQSGQSGCKNCPANLGGGPSSGRTSRWHCHSCGSDQAAAAGQACQTCRHGKHRGENMNRCYKHYDCERLDDHIRYLLGQLGFIDPAVIYPQINQVQGWMDANC